MPPQSLQLRQTRGRLELTVPPYIHMESSYLLASDTPTERLAMRWQALCVESESTNTTGTSMFMVMKISTHIKV